MGHLEERTQPHCTAKLLWVPDLHLTVLHLVSILQVGRGAGGGGPLDRA